MLVKATDTQPSGQDMAYGIWYTRAQVAEQRFKRVRSVIIQAAGRREYDKQIDWLGD